MYALLCLLHWGWLVVPVLTLQTSSQRVMKKYSISPAEIRVKAGEGCELEVRTADVQHGSMSQSGIKESVRREGQNRVTIKTDRKGESRTNAEYSRPSP